jgi:hypothetical protein
VLIEAAVVRTVVTAVTIHVQRLEDRSNGFNADRRLVPANALRPR